MTEIALQDAQKDLPALLDRVQAGEQIIITRDGQAVAQVNPVEPVRPRPSPQEIERIFAELDRISARTRPGPPTIREMIEEGRL